MRLSNNNNSPSFGLFIIDKSALKTFSDEDRRTINSVCQKEEKKLNKICKDVDVIMSSGVKDVLVFRAFKQVASLKDFLCNVRDVFKFSVSTANPDEYIDLPEGDLVQYLAINEFNNKNVRKAVKDAVAGSKKYFGN